MLHNNVLMLFSWKKKASITRFVSQVSVPRSTCRKKKKKKWKHALWGKYQSIVGKESHIRTSLSPTNYSLNFMKTLNLGDMVIFPRNLPRKRPRYSELVIVIDINIVSHEFVTLQYEGD